MLDASLSTARRLRACPRSVGWAFAVSRHTDLSAPGPAGEAVWLRLGPPGLARGRAVVRHALEQLVGYVDHRGQFVRERMPCNLAACLRCVYREVCRPDLGAPA